MKPSLRQGLVFTALFATGVAAYFAPPSPDGTVDVVARPGKHTVAATDQRSIELDSAALFQGEQPDLRIRDENEGQELLVAFAPSQPPPPPAPPPSPVVVVSSAPPATVVSPPVPPALPFRVAGRVSDDGGNAVFVIFNDKDLVVHAGEPIGTDYTVSSVTTNLLTFVYKPLGVTQTIALTAFQ